MMRHPYFDLFLHETASLSALLGAPVVARETLSEWPLSCVQRLRTADGRTAIYKAQIEPTVEPQFYAAARSPVVIASISLPNPHGPAGLLLEDVKAVRLSDLSVAPADALHVVRRVSAEIAGVGGGLPAMTDLRTSEGFQSWMTSLLADLTALMEDGAFRRVTLQDIAIVTETGATPVVLDALAGKAGYLHGDLNGENVLVSANGVIRAVIDWQRPLFGPIALDQAMLMESLGADPLPFVGPGIMALLALSRIAWFAACARRWFPPGAETYDLQIAALIGALSTYHSSVV